ncbi:amidohydrolase [Sphingomonas sp. DBB INV C78]|uniref:N-acyl-D-amino-acid deacylase family protein n=1 Tax=Sphingomonas sp. DBB INV C78 TaxID=3349434 RepID=UPI0036D39D34
MFDTIVRGGMIVDGTGNSAYSGDVAIKAGKIVAVGKDLGAARDEVDAGGRIVTPGWVDIHSHYDGQATWDPLLSPSGQHGVTTTVMGNCGVGFAPARPSDRDALITLMEGVEDIPGSALSEGLPWTWQSFPEYLDRLDEMPRVMDVAALMPHSAVRAFVMGPEESIRGVATPAETAEMSRIVREGIKAGAIGFSTSRTKLHLSADGKPVPGSFVEMEELLTLGRAVGEGGGGMLQLVCDWSRDDPAREFAWIRRLSEETGQPLSFTLVQFDETPEHPRRLLSLLAEARAEGLPIHAGVGSRPVGMLINLESKIHPFSDYPSYAEIAGLPLAGKLARMRDPAFRARMLAEESTSQNRYWRPKMQAWSNMFPLGNPPQYEPGPERSMAAASARTGRTPQEMVYDLMTAGEGAEWLYFPMINYSEGSLEPQLEMMRDPGGVLSLADGGAHCGLICDASAPTFQITHWVQSRERGPRLGLEEAVHFQTGRTAAMWGFNDRGVIAPGKRADLNIIDLDRLKLLPPRWAADLPAGGRRLLQDAEGYDATFVAGRMTWRHGEPTGERPGRLVRKIEPLGV